MPDENAPTLYFPDLKDLAVFSEAGPSPQFLADLPHFKALVAGLEPGGRIPLHLAGPAIYHFLEGTGLMTVDAETYAVQPGVTIYAPDGARRGINARTRLIFLGAKGA